MSIHPSLKGLGKLSSKKSILKRGERIKWLMSKKMWSDESPIFGLPKIKVVKIKVAKKEKKEEKKEEAATETKESTS
ncbi:MAG: small basic protein [Candidatus Omnitrophica bacterium]|nr:small basic protein [Candidatus Omnitrophota bacterium]